jgi:FkbM family methyltransferase
MKESYSQLGQDLFIAKHFKYKSKGFFVEIGVGDGVNLSNTYLLEKNYNWNGILCEPHPDDHKSIKINRNCFLEQAAAYSESNMQVEFNMCKIKELSGIKTHMKTSHSIHAKDINKVINVKTISLNDLLKKYNAPTKIDYISLDTEGSEFEIIKSFNFDNYKVSVWSIEHNSMHRSDGEQYLMKLKKHMKSKNYYFVPNQFDSYFIHEGKNKIYS